MHKKQLKEATTLSIGKDVLPMKTNHSIDTRTKDLFLQPQKQFSKLRGFVVDYGDDPANNKPLPLPFGIKQGTIPFYLLGGALLLLISFLCNLIVPFPR